MVVKEEYIPTQGDIVQLNYDSNLIGNEQRGRRPGLVISEQKLNDFTSLCMICPITNNKKCFPFQVELSHNQKTKGIIMCEQLKSINFRERKIKFLEKIKPKELEEVLEIMQGIFF